MLFTGHNTLPHIWCIPLTNDARQIRSQALFALSIVFIMKIMYNIYRSLL
jgi:hypothetical protein